MDVYDRIDRLIKEKGVSRRKAAQMAGIPPATLNTALSRKKGLSASAVSSLAKALDVDATFLLYGLEVSRVKKRREALSMTQEQLAEKSGVDVQTIIAYESNETTSSLDMLERLASALGCSVADLHPGVDAPNLPYVTTAALFDFSETLRLNMNHHFDALNESGQKEAAKRIYELAQIPEYQK
jgi:transcriptional regulator with XRE-family HTH domain